jgi:hypothetical protein
MNPHCTTTARRGGPTPQSAKMNRDKGEFQ